MAQARTKMFCVLLSLALALSLAPVASYASVSSESQEATDPALVGPSLDSAIPTEGQLESAVSNQLIVTYADNFLDIGDSTKVAEIDGSPLEEIAESAPNKQVTLADLGAVESDVVSDKDSDCDIPATSLLTFEDGVDLQEAAAQLLSSPDVESVQPNFVYELFSIGATSYYDATANRPARHPTNDPYSYVDVDAKLNQSYIYTTKIADAWAAGYRANGNVSVAVIDSGPRLDHPDLASAWDLDHARDFTSGGVDGDTYKDDPAYWNGRTGYECHGTWVSGVLAATANNRIGIAGTSYNARVIPLKVTDGKKLKTDVLIKAYRYLDRQVEAGNLPSLKVINLSMGGEDPDYGLCDMIDHMAKKHNILTVAAAGNNGDDGHIYPADFSNVLSVMATASDFTRASFSNYGGKSVSAPGIEITTTIPYSESWPNRDSGKYSKTGINGTSFSSPIVAGVAALCYSVKPTATAAEVRYSITSGATSLKNIDSTCAPYINALQAVKNVLSGKGLYEATHTSISKAKVASIATRTYSGSRFKPTPKVTLNGKTLKRGVDYTLAYSGNKLPGKATVTIKAKGVYKGSKKVTFKIIPKASKVLRLKTGYRSITVKWKTQKSCSSGYQVRYSTSSKRYSSKKLKSGRTLTIAGKSKSSRVLKNLKSKKRYYVQVRAYKKSSGTCYYSKWSSLKKIKTR